jgi:hypothetical protein
MSRKRAAAVAVVALLVSAALAGVAAGRSQRKPPHGTIAGIAYLSVSGPPHVATRPEPERGIKVVAKSANGHSRTITTSGNGQFSLFVPPGTYDVTARIGEPVTNREHECGPAQHVTVHNGTVRHLRVVCNLR